MKSRLLAVTKLSKEKGEILIKLSQYLEIDNWPEGEFYLRRYTLSILCWDLRHTLRRHRQGPFIE
jgi:hypothetical protein